MEVEQGKPQALCNQNNPAISDAHCQFISIKYKRVTSTTFKDKISSDFEKMASQKFTLLILSLVPFVYADCIVEDKSTKEHATCVFPFTFNYKDSSGTMVNQTFYGCRFFKTIEIIYK